MILKDIVYESKIGYFFIYVLKKLLLFIRSGQENYKTSKKLLKNSDCLGLSSSVELLYSDENAKIVNFLKTPPKKVDKWWKLRRDRDLSAIFGV